MSLTDDLAAARTSADGLAALCEASGRVATGRLTARGLIEGVPDALATLVGVGSDQLRGTRLTSIVDVADRPTVNSAIDSVLEHSRRARLTTNLLHHAPEPVPVPAPPPPHATPLGHIPTPSLSP